jgi:para-nitrobenzyl esterase
MSETATASGRVRGIDNESSVVFKGIPFAAPPTGERRFQPPQPAEPWAGVRECTRFGAICPQFRLSGGGGVNSCFEADEPMDEDCLFLNVWTPRRRRCSPTNNGVHPRWRVPQWQRLGARL